MILYTIGFTKKTAYQFFEALRSAGVRRVIDVRLNNVSQLAGFAKMQDLRYFLDQIDNIKYEHATALAPAQEMLDTYRKHKGTWAEYERRFLELMKDRRVETVWAEALQDFDCLLCSEERPDRCHRRLVAEYLAPYRGDVEIRHLL
jgi:uncharacterized protein (DUF488 family)